MPLGFLVARLACFIERPYFTSPELTDWYRWAGWPASASTELGLLAMTQDTWLLDSLKKQNMGSWN